jgi:hypothetical protein
MEFSENGVHLIYQAQITDGANRALSSTAQGKSCEGLPWRATELLRQAAIRDRQCVVEELVENQGISWPESLLHGGLATLRELLQGWWFGTLEKRASNCTYN